MSHTPAPRTLVDIFGERAANDTGRSALTVDGRLPLTLAEWERCSLSVAHGLDAMGVGRGDRIAILADGADWVDYAVATLAVYRVGATAVAMTPDLGYAEIGRRLAECDVTGLVHTAMTSPPAVRCWVESVAALDNGGTAELGTGPEPTDVAEILYTSGTTGTPKPIAVPHANLTHGRDGRGDLFGGIDSILCAVPAATNAGHSALMVAITTGSTAHVLSHVTAAESAAVIERERIQQAILTPVVAKQLVAQGLHLRHDLSSVKTLMFGSSAVPPAAMSELSRSLPRAQIMVGYGSTESAPGFCRRMLPSWEEHGDPDHYRGGGLHCLGGPGGGTEVRVAGPDGESVPDGRPGEICLRSEAPTRSYLVPQAGPPTFGADGWVRMGDIGLVGDDGQLYFIDRAPDVIPTAAGPQSSVRLETSLLWHPDVVDVAVVAMGTEPDVEVVAVVEPRDSDVDHERLEAELTATLREALAEVAGAAAPPARAVVDSLPRGPLGKVRKRLLRTRYAPASVGTV